MTSCEPRPGEIWLAYVEFSDHPGVGKVRPVVIVEVEREMCTVLAVKVTSKDLREKGGGHCIPIIDWDQCGLRKPSFIRLDQKLELAFESILREKPIGRLPKAYLSLIRQELST